MNEIVYKTNGWNEWSKYVLMTIDAITRDVQKLEEQTVNNREELLAKIAELNRNIVELNTTMKIRNRTVNIVVGMASGIISGVAVGLLVNFLI